MLSYKFSVAFDEDNSRISRLALNEGGNIR